MGLFGGSKTRVGTSISRVLEDDQLPNTLKRSLISGILGEGSVTDRVLEGILNGPAIKMDRYFRYARDNYVHGLPNAQYINSGTQQEEAKAALQARYPEPLTFDYLRLGPLDYTHAGWQALYDDYGYRFETNELEVLSHQYGTPVYLDNMREVYVLPEADDTDNDYRSGGFWPTPASGHTPEKRAQDVWEIGSQALPSDHLITAEGDDRVEVFFVYVNATGEVVRNKFVVSLDGYDLDAAYYQAMFHLERNGEKKTVFFTYQQGAGQYPVLDQLHSPDYVNAGTYFPFLFFRQFNKNLVAESEHDTDLYKTSARMAKYLGIDYQDFGDAIHENPDIDDVRHAALMVAVPANSDDPADLRYLFDYFRRLHQQDRDGGDQRDPESRYEDLRRSGLEYVPKAVAIQDGGFNLALGFEEIVKRTRIGSVGDVGSYSRTQGSEEREVVVAVLTAYGRPTGEYKTRKVQRKYQCYRLQTTRLTYEEIKVYGLMLRYDVYKGYEVVAHTHDDKLLVPVDKEIADTYTLIDKEKLYFRALHTVFNAKVTEKVKWYESGLFKAIMIAVAVVAAVYGGGYLSATIMSAIEGGALAVAWAVMEIVVTSLAVNYAFKLVIQEIGLEAAMVLAVALAVASFGTSLTNTGQFMSISAEQMMMASTNFSSAVSSETTRLMDKYNSENQEFELFKEEKFAELEKAQDLLETNNLIDPFEFIGMEPITVFGESPDRLYDRTIHSGNIGANVYDYIHSYADINLRLPTFNESVGGLI